MSTALVASRASMGLQAPAVDVEIHLSNGLPAFTIVGLPESTVREARERVRSALLTSHFDWPDRRITVSLAPAEIPKAGGRFDLPIALGLLVASNQLPAAALEGREFYGELGLDGSLRPCRGILAAVRACTDAGKCCAIPSAQVSAMARIPASTILAAPDLLTLCGLLKVTDPPTVQSPPPSSASPTYPDIADIRGQTGAKRALEIAASGGHHLLMCGPPGAGKTLLASVLPGLMPAIAEDELLELMLLRDLLGLPPELRRPMRSPHHSTSGAALIGGGSHALPGEVSLATGGILFLDELPEFPGRVLDLLRQPLETGSVTVARAKAINRYPARFQLVAAMNPCPCGFAGSADPPCRCTGDTVARYQSRVSGPLMDRIDLHVPLERQGASILFEEPGDAESSAVIRARVSLCRTLQLERQGSLNSDLAGVELTRHCALETPVQRWFETACDRLKLSARSIHRSLRIGRTLADMRGEARVGEAELMEALSYRPRLGS